MNPNQESVESLAESLLRLRRVGMEDEMLAWITVQIHVARSFLGPTSSVTSVKLLLDLVIRTLESETNVDSRRFSVPYNQLLQTFATLARDGKITPKKSVYWEYHSLVSGIRFLWDHGKIMDLELGSSDTVTYQFKPTKYVLQASEFLEVRQLLASNLPAPSHNSSTQGPVFTLDIPGTTSDEYASIVKIQWPDS